MKPLGDRVVIKRNPIEDEKMPSGLFIPQQSQEKPLVGKVVSFGPGRYENGVRVPIGVAEGDEILFGKYSGIEVKIDGEDYLILREEEILVVL
jgi:chaperonin GroES